MIEYIGSVTGLAPLTIFEILVAVGVSSILIILMYLIYKVNDKEQKEVQSESNKRYTFGNYAHDVKQFVELYKTAQTIPEQKELKAVCDRIIEGSKHMTIIGKNSFNGMLIAGIKDTLKVCHATLSYISDGVYGINELRNTASFDVDYYFDTERVLGVTKSIRTEHQVKLYKIKQSRIPQYSKRLASKKSFQRNSYLARIGRWGRQGR